MTATVPLPGCATFSAHRFALSEARLSGCLSASPPPLPPLPPSPPSPRLSLLQPRPASWGRWMLVAHPAALGCLTCLAPGCHLPALTRRLSREPVADAASGRRDCRGALASRGSKAGCKGRGGARAGGRRDSGTRGAQGAAAVIDRRLAVVAAHTDTRTREGPDPIPGPEKLCKRLQFAPRKTPSKQPTHERPPPPASALSSPAVRPPSSPPPACPGADVRPLLSSLLSSLSVPPSRRQAASPSTPRCSGKPPPRHPSDVTRPYHCEAVHAPSLAR